MIYLFSLVRKSKNTAPSTFSCSYPSNFSTSASFVNHLISDCSIPYIYFNNRLYLISFHVGWKVCWKRHIKITADLYILKFILEVHIPCFPSKFKLYGLFEKIFSELNQVIIHRFILFPMGFISTCFVSHPSMNSMGFMRRTFENSIIWPYTKPYYFPSTCRLLPETTRSLICLYYLHHFFSL